MSIDVDTLSEAFSILKHYIPSKDRQEAADNLIGSMVDMLSDQDLKDFSASDRVLSKAYAEYVGEDDDQDEENEDL
jgi:hypothetical protein